MFRSNHEIALRDSLCEEIKVAFERAGVGVVYQRDDGMPYSSVIAYLNFGFGGQRQALVKVSDNGDCNAYMSKIYSVPEGSIGRHIDPGRDAIVIHALPSNARSWRDRSPVGSGRLPSTILRPFRRRCLRLPNLPSRSVS